MRIIVFILGLSLLITIHELGHFIVAKIFGVYCHEFSIGMGPAIFSKKKGETEKDIVRIFARRNVPKLIEAIHKANGIAILAHSACCWTINHEHFIKEMMKIGLDGLEVYYPYKRHRGIIKFHFAESIKKIADKFNLIKTGGSDTHKNLM